MASLQVAGSSIEQISGSCLFRVCEDGFLAQVFNSVPCLGDVFLTNSLL